MAETVRKLFTATFTKASDDERAYDATLSTADVDRERDRVLAEGWVLPPRVPLLWAHDLKALPVGRVRDMRVVGKALRGRVEFPAPLTHPFADVVHKLIEAGFLGDLSVGFSPLDKPRTNDQGGFDFGRKELVEVSVVNVPANVAARVDGRADEAAVRKWLDEGSADVVVEIDDDDQDTGVDAATFRRGFQDAVRAALLSAVQRGVAEAIERRGRGARTSEPFADPAVRHHSHVGDDDVVCEVDPEDLRVILGGVVRETLAGVVRAETMKALRRAAGRVD
jgi:HK97 family phage prohead protease